MVGDEVVARHLLEGNPWLVKGQKDKEAAERSRVQNCFDNSPAPFVLFDVVLDDRQPRLLNLDTVPNLTMHSYTSNDPWNPSNFETHFTNGILTIAVNGISLDKNWCDPDWISLWAFAKMAH
ncbi:hypothetical protein C1H46_026862 [Malus baccata]|uniref:Uncharacterized protein n=1 Tax=Malus baccata TaxID=106549 RepID=A0A540LM67_MALBA|nr:hypothetical protein C1H46_026862 [Malus baccata]